MSDYFTKYKTDSKTAVQRIIALEKENNVLKDQIWRLAAKVENQRREIERVKK